MIGPTDQGKSTLEDVICSSHGCCVQNYNRDYYEYWTYDYDVISPPTITTIPLLLNLPPDSSYPEHADGPDFLINLYPSNLLTNVTSRLRVIDGIYGDSVLVSYRLGAFMVVDVIEGVLNRTEHIIQALMERVIPILVINKLDRPFLEFQSPYEDIYQTLLGIIQEVNNIFATYHDQTLGNITLDPVKGNVIFSSGMHGWGFTLKQFAVLYADKLGVDEDKMTERLWGDNYFDPEEKKWTTNSISSSGKTLQRSFCKFILEPIGKIMDAAMNDKQNEISRMLKAINVKLLEDERQSQGRRLVKVILKTWLPLNTTLLERAVNYLPSPVQAQKYRAEILYTGPQDDITAEAIRKCDPKGPLTVYVVTMLPTADKKRFYALGRVFSGTIHSGQTVRVFGDSKQFQPQKMDENILIKGSIQTVHMIGARIIVPVDNIGPGNYCVISGIDQHVIKTATLTSDETSYPMNTPFVGTAPVIRFSVEPTIATDLPKLIEGLKLLQKQQPMIHVKCTETGHWVVAGEDERLIEAVIKECCHVPSGIKVSGPHIVYKETVISQSSQICMERSSNKHNRIYATAMPMERGLTEVIQKLNYPPNTFLSKGGSENLVRDFGWKLEQVKNIWCFGSETEFPSMLLNSTNSVTNMVEIKDSVCAAFQWVTKEGVLAEEGIHGVRWNLMDAVLHSDAVHRGGGQIIPTARRAFYAAMLTAQPRLMEPIYQIEIQCSQHVIGSVYSLIDLRRGSITAEIPRPGTAFVNIRGYLPAEGVIGFHDSLRASTGGEAYLQTKFDHYEVINDDPFENGTRSNEIVKSIRKRKGLGEVIPPLDKFNAT